MSQRPSHHGGGSDAEHLSRAAYKVTIGKAFLLCWTAAATVSAAGPRSLQLQRLLLRQINSVTDVARRRHRNSPRQTYTILYCGRLRLPVCRRANAVPHDK